MTSNRWPAVALGDILTLSRDPERVDPAAEYPNLGIYSFGRGVFPKTAIRGDTTSASTLYRVREGQIIYSRLFAFEGAFAAVPAEMDGWFVSNEYPTFDIDPSRTTAEFVRMAITRPEMWQEMAAMTVGMGHRRQRLQPDAFLEFEISLPSLDEQDQIVRAASVFRRRVAATTVELATAETLRKALLTHVYEELNEKAQETRPLGELAAVESGMAWSRHDECAAADGVVALRVANVQQSGVDLSELRYILPSTKGAHSKTIKPHSLILVRTNTAARVGNAQLLPKEAVGFAYSSFLIQVTPKVPEDRDVIARVLQAPEIQAEMTERAQGTSASLANIPVTWLREIEIPVMDAQARNNLLRPLMALETVIEGLREELEELKRLQDSTVTALLAGRRRICEILAA